MKPSVHATGPFWLPRIRAPVEPHQCTRRKEHPMLDFIMLAMGLGFFALAVGYTIACDRL